MRFVFLLLLFPLCGFCADKILILIIASDQFPVYKRLHASWERYMDSDPEHIEAYFVRGDPDLDRAFKIEGHTIWTKTAEGWPPHHPGIINKTILSMKAFEPRLKEFQYVLRTNLSSFYVFPRLLDYVRTLPEVGCYSAAPIHPNASIGSGAGFLLSSDVAQLLIAHEAEFLGQVGTEDDMLVGKFLERHHIPLIAHARCDFLDLESFYKQRENLPENVFQFRVKTGDQDRFVHDSLIHSALWKVFY